MPLPDETSFAARKFSGTVRLFPLPNLVVYPHVMQPLHIFESRYRAMLEAALADDQLIAMAVLAPGWERDYEGRPAVLPAACLCNIATHQRTDDGNYNVLMVGMKRIEIVSELPPVRPFREARVRVRHDDYSEKSSRGQEARQRALFAEFKRILPPGGKTGQDIEQLLGKQVSLGMFTDIVAYSLGIAIEEKMALLAEANVDRRVDLLLKCISELEPAQSAQTSFPPDFSVN